MSVLIEWISKMGERFLKSCTVPSSLAGAEEEMDVSSWDERVPAAQECRLCLQELWEGDSGLVSGFKLVTKAGWAAVGRMDCQSHCSCAWEERPFLGPSEAGQ